MKVKDLIALLEKVEDKDREVVVAVGTHTQAYPVAYLPIYVRDHLAEAWGEVRVHVSFPEGYSVAQRKRK